MKKITVLVIFSLLLWADSAVALLIDRGGGLIYDTVLNVTWLQDANYAKTSGYDEDGLMNWYKANVWVEGLSYYDSIRNTAWTDWRLPKNEALNGKGYIWEWDQEWPWPDIVDIRRVNGSIDCGYNISAPGSVYAGSIQHEMAYMYYNNLGNLAPLTVDGQPNSHYGLENTGPFINIQAYPYWVSGYSWPDSETVFYCYLGLQTQWFANHNPGSFYLDEGGVYAWAVRDGDVGAPPGAPIPLPGTLVLFGSGLVGLGILRKKMGENGRKDRNTA